MGKKSDQIEREIALKRDEISSRIDGLQERMREDIQNVSADAKERSSRAIDDTKETLKLDNVKQIIEDHTLTTMAGAVGVGVLLGMASEGLPGRANGHRDSGRQGDYGRSDAHAQTGGGIASIFGSLLAPAASTAQNELEDLVRQGFATLKGQVRQSGHEDRRVENRDVGVE